MMTIGRNSYLARVEEDGTGVTHQILTWQPAAVLRFLAQYHVPKTKLMFTLYPLGGSPLLVHNDMRAYALLQEDIAGDTCESC